MKKDMADLDKNMIMGMLQSLLGDEKKETSQAEKTPSERKEQTESLPVVPSPQDTDDFINTAAMMSHFTELIGKFRQASNTREAALLSALRPYLRASRQPKVDTMLRALQAIRVFSDMKKNNS